MEDTKQPSNMRISPDPSHMDAVLGGFIARQDLKAFVEQIPAPVAIVRGRNGIVEVCNLRFRKALGNRPVLGLAMRTAWPELEASGHFEHIERVFDTGQPAYLHEYPGFIDRHDSSQPDEAFFDFTFAPYKKANGQTIGLILYGTDITAQVQARREAESNQARLELILATARIGAWEWDITHNTCAWSVRMKKLYGLDPTETITPARHQAFVHPEDWPLIQAAAKNAQTTGSKGRLEYRVRWPNGETHWLLSNYAVVRRRDQSISLVGMAMNIDTGKATQLRLRESEQRFRELADSAPVPIWMVDARRQGYFFNQAWLDFTGRTMAQEAGVGWTESIHARDFAAAMATYSQAFDEQKAFKWEYRLRRYDGRYRWVVTTGVPRFADDRTFLGYVATCVDIDEIKHGQELERMNAQLKKQRTQLMALNSAKDEFISIASHQLRTPASAVKQYVGLLLEGYVGELTDMQLKMVQAAYDSNQRQLSVIEALLRVAQVDAGKITPVKRTCDIVQLLEDVIEEQQAKFKQREQKLNFEHPPVPLIISVDQRLLRMVLENLIDNASKYSPDGKAITITVNRKRTAIVLRISDNGVGISAKDQEKLFQKFSRLNNPLSSLVSGSGLGLYWAKKIIDLHGGDITVQSQENSGSTFTITLPLQ